jgi:hypothetical protein
MYLALRKIRVKPCIPESYEKQKTLQGNRLIRCFFYDRLVICGRRRKGCMKMINGIKDAITMVS